ncbi:rhomboid family intramembrane serine protease [Bacillus carboniphilus]|uniref:Rhomboid family intramembrane serine protease n=1 Tax=Bacillus carboniphilus TaxID=86663 RepID=A0ABY9JX04_9BACI|nr:rhomboid family intramembrane serine protease [Bacillus carboniphilus]WLR43942.1 rhomboid family intramembrane serine protease [Bacillus carboniphilus]
MLNQDFTFWKIINTLVFNEKYRLVKLSENQSEAWLEPSTKQPFQLVRLVRYDLDWSNWIDNDLERLGKQMEVARKQLLKRDFQILNIYVSTFLPVDDFQQRIESLHKENKTSIKTMIVSQAENKESLEKLSEKINCSIPEEEDIDSYEKLDEIKRRIIAHTNNLQKQEKKLLNNGKPFFTKVFLVVQILIFFLMELVGDSTSTSTLLKFGAKYNPFIIEGDWWRLITPIFIHIGFAHLLMNSLALYLIGAAVERMYGSSRFIIIYLLAGIGGTLGSFAFNSGTISAGASGAIFGCFGALLYLGVLKPTLFLRTIGPNILVLIGINLVFGFIVPGIDNAGHIGGLVGGFLAASMTQIPKNNKWVHRVVGLSSLIVIFLFLYFVGIRFTY